MLKTGQAPVSILQLTPCSISMLWAEKGLCATETILLAELLQLWKAWTSRSSGWGSWKSVWHSLTATATHLGVSRALPAMPGATGSATSLTSLTRAGSVCLALLRHIPHQHRNPVLLPGTAPQTVPAAICRKLCECFHEFSWRSYAQGVAVGKTSVSYTRSLKCN